VTTVEVVVDPRRVARNDLVRSGTHVKGMNESPRGFSKKKNESPSSNPVLGSWNGKTRDVQRARLMERCLCGGFFLF
jgi:hypothetical protein